MTTRSDSVTEVASCNVTVTTTLHITPHHSSSNWSCRGWIFHRRTEQHKNCRRLISTVRQADTVITLKNCGADVRTSDVLWLSKTLLRTRLIPPLYIILHTLLRCNCACVGNADILLLLCHAPIERSIKRWWSSSVSLSVYPCMSESREWKA